MSQHSDDSSTDNWNHSWWNTGARLSQIVNSMAADNLGLVSMQRCHLPPIGYPIVDIRRSWDLISRMGFPMLVRWRLYIEPTLAPCFARSSATMGLTHYSDVIMGMMTSQFTGLTIVYSTVYSGGHQIKHQSSASLAFVRGIHRWPVNYPHKGPVTRKMFPFDDVIMCMFTFVTFDVYTSASFAQGPFLLHGLTLNPAWIRNYVQSKVLDEIIYPFQHFNS